MDAGVQATKRCPLPGSEEVFTLSPTLPQASYVEALCMLLLDNYVQLQMNDATLELKDLDLEAQKEELTAKKGKEKESVIVSEQKVLKLEERVQAIQRAEQEVRLRHFETLARIIEKKAVKTAPFDEPAFWREWNEEIMRFHRAYVPLTSLALELSDELGKAIDEEGQKQISALTKQIEQFRKARLEKEQKRLKRILNQRHL
jgi:hypothetical protein